MYIDVNAVKKWYGVAKPQSVEANYVSKMKDALSEAYDKYIAGIRAASENLRNMEKPADKGGAKLQGRGSTTFNDNDNSESKEILRITEENISKVSDKQIFNIDKDFVFKSNNKSNDIFDYFATIRRVLSRVFSTILTPFSYQMHKTPTEFDFDLGRCFLCISECYDFGL